MDSNDKERVGEAREELMRMLAEDELRDSLLLVFANKQVSLNQNPLPAHNFNKKKLNPKYILNYLILIYFCVLISFLNIK